MLWPGSLPDSLHPLVHRDDRLRGDLLFRGGDGARCHEGRWEGTPHSLPSHDRWVLISQFIHTTEPNLYSYVGLCAIKEGFVGSAEQVVGESPTLERTDLQLSSSPGTVAVDSNV